MAELFEDIFDINAVDKDGKPFDKVSRIFCTGETFKMELILDVHTASYAVRSGEKFRFSILRNLINDNRLELEDHYDVDNDNEMNEFTDEMEEANLANCDYCIHGKIYRIFPSETEDGTFYAMYVSFGGLLMMLKGAAVNFSGLKVGNYIYVKINRIAY